MTFWPFLILIYTCFTLCSLCRSVCGEGPMAHTAWRGFMSESSSALGNPHADTTSTATASSTEPWSVSPAFGHAGVWPWHSSHRVTATRESFTLYSLISEHFKMFTWTQAGRLVLLLAQRSSRWMHCLLQCGWYNPFICTRFQLVLF